MRALKALIAATAMVAALLPAGIAAAWPHSPPEDVHTRCQVDGSVTLDNGLDNNRSTDHYTFVDASLTCTTDVPALAPDDYTGVYNVEAEGDTTGYGHGSLSLGGEDCDQGGSTEVDGEYHTGTLDAVRDDSFTINGNVHFVRLGTEVLADGPLTDENGVKSHFFAQLVFIPNNVPPESCDPNAGQPVKTADLVGEAVIGVSVVGDDGHDHVCLEYGITTDDPHCIL